MSELFARIEPLFAERGEGQYGSERVTQRAHALQCAALASEEGASDPLIVAALLLNVGHVLHDLGTEARTRGVDDHHETRAAEWLAASFGEDVAAPVRLQVAAKRWLCVADPGYHAVLSPAEPPSLETYRSLIERLALA